MVWLLHGRALGHGRALLYARVRGRAHVRIHVHGALRRGRAMLAEGP